MAEDSFTIGVVVGLVIGLFVGIPVGYVVAQALRPKDDSVVTLERDEVGRITAILEKHLR